MDLQSIPEYWLHSQFDPELTLAIQTVALGVVVFCIYRRHKLMISLKDIVWAKAIDGEYRRTAYPGDLRFVERRIRRQWFLAATAAVVMFLLTPSLLYTVRGLF